MALNDSICDISNNKTGFRFIFCFAFLNYHIRLTIFIKNVTKRKWLLPGPCDKTNFISNDQ